MEKSFTWTKEQSDERIGGPRIICECRLGAGDWLLKNFVKLNDYGGNSH